MSRLKYFLPPTAALLALLTLTGCVAYPAGYEGGGYYAAPSAVVAVPVPVYRPYYGGYYGGGWGRGGGGWGRGGGRWR